MPQPPKPTPTQPKSDAVKVALLEMTTTIIEGIIQHTEPVYHVQLLDQIDGIIDKVMRSVAEKYKAHLAS